MQNLHILLSPLQIAWLTEQSRIRGSISRAAVIRQLIAAAMQQRTEA